jgi:hypothetical protein
MRAAEKYREDLLKRGVLLIPLVWNASKTTKPKKRLGFGGKPPVVCDSSPLYFCN